jgi:CelD/BcsL family acetyltransferase involved in cellulose biosynthesis
MDIQIHNDITNKKLVDSWKTIVEKNGYLPQSTYEWCATWWKHFSDSKTELHIITVLENDDIIGIAPMFIVKKFLNKQLKFIGTGLTDFHELLITKSKYVDVFNRLLEYFNSFNKWDVVLFDQINNELSDYNYLLGNSIKNKFVIECPIIDITNTSWDGYIKNLNSKNQRKMVRRRIKEYGDQNFSFQKITAENSANVNIKELIHTHINRWDQEQEQMNSKFKKSNMFNFIVEVFYQLLNSNLAVCYIVKNNAEIVSYRLGFITNKIYYDWNTSFNPKYSNHSPGLISVALAIMDLIENQYRQFHFMRGGYDYKKRWMMKGHDHISQNYLFLLSKPNLKGEIIEKYYLGWRDQIKNNFTKIIQKPYFKRLAGL